MTLTRFEEKACVSELPIFTLCSSVTTCYRLPHPLCSTVKDLKVNPDIVLFPYRDYYYDKDASRNSAELLLRKNRQGPTGAVKLIWNAEYFSFGNFTEVE